MDRRIVGIVAAIAVLLLAPAAGASLLGHDVDPGVVRDPDAEGGDGPDGDAPAPDAQVDLALPEPPVPPGILSLPAEPHGASTCMPGDEPGPSVSVPPLPGRVRSPPGACPTGDGEPTPARGPPARSTGIAPHRGRQPDRSRAAPATAGDALVPSGWGRDVAAPGHVPLVAGLIAVVAWVLYRRLTRDRLLDNDLRRQVRDLVEDAPGVTAAAIADELDVHYDTVRHHLRVLDDFDEIRVDRFGSTRRYFPNHGRYTADDRALLAALRVESRRRVLETLTRDGGLSSGELAEAIGVAPSTVSHHLAALESVGLVERTRDGRSVRCELTQGAKAGLRMFG